MLTSLLLLVVQGSPAPADVTLCGQGMALLVDRDGSGHMLTVYSDPKDNHVRLLLEMKGKKARGTWRWDAARQHGSPTWKGTTPWFRRAGETIKGTHYEVRDFADGKPKGICSGTAGPNLFCLWVGFWDKETKACDVLQEP
jgi:hypothetical protein